MTIKIVSGSPDDDDEWGRDPATRRNDGEGSRLGAEDAKMRANSQKARLLMVYAETLMPMIPDEAASLAGINIQAASHWKRCGELMELGFLSDTGQLRMSSRTGSKQRVYQVTELGRMRVRTMLGL